MASSTPINGLPVELLTEIFKSLDSIADVVHLGSTSRLFRDMWKSSAHTIYDVILPRSIPAYKQTRTLAIAIVQRHNEKSSQRGHPRRISYELPSNKAKLAVWLSRAAAHQIEAYEVVPERRECCLARTCDPWLAIDSSHHTANTVKLNAHERSKFLESYYNLWMLTVMSRSEAKEHIASMRVGHVDHTVPLAHFGLTKIVYPTKIAWKSMPESEDYWDPLLQRLTRCFVVHIMRVVRPKKISLV